MKNNFHIKVKEVLRPQFFKEQGYQSVMEVPRLQKIVISMMVKQAITNKQALKDAIEELGLITGQKPFVTKAKKSVATFKLRLHMKIGCKVTLRGDRMYGFLDRLITIVLPRIRDFRGLKNKSFDNQGNYNLGIKEEIIFPEIDYDKIKINKGMNITLVTNTNDCQKSLLWLRFLGLPIQK